MMVVEDMASMPPRNRLSVLLQSKRRPVAPPTPIIQPITMAAATTGRMPIFNIFLIENSKPSENIKKMTPMLLHVSMEL